MFAKINGIKLYFDMLGNGQALFFIHGLGENADSWFFQKEFFKESFKVITMDLRGHHRTENGDKVISIELFAEDIIALMDYLKIEKAHFVGISMGGLILQELTKKYQYRISTLSICDSAAFVTEENSNKLEGRKKMIQEKNMDEMSEFIVKTCLAVPYKQEVYDMAFNIFRLNRKIPYTQSTIATFSVDYRNDLKNILIPTLLLVGKQDITTPISANRYMQSEIKNSELVIIPDAGHLTKIEQPELFNREIKKFIDKHIYT